MRFILALLGGTIGGAAAAGLVLYFNPLSGAPAQAALAADWTLEYDYPEKSSIALTHGGEFLLPHVPPEIASFWETAIDGTLLNVLVLQDATGSPLALATRMSIPSAETNLLLRGVIVADHWLVTLPGRGTIYIEAHNNVWPLLRDTFVRVGWLRGTWRGPTSYAVTEGPGPRNSAAVFGMSGDFAGARGVAVESYKLESFSAAGGIEALRGSLAIALDAP